jgi:hypothetical protein
MSLPTLPFPLIYELLYYIGDWNCLLVLDAVWREVHRKIERSPAYFRTFVNEVMTRVDAPCDYAHWKLLIRRLSGPHYLMYRNERRELIKFDILTESVTHSSKIPLEYNSTWNWVSISPDEALYWGGNDRNPTDSVYLYNFKSQFSE